ncbi:Ig-like domain-containing protein [Thermococcus sp. 2319x1]|uniref:Ig-like domain-containing protein n=1 Tax=Thermococcus sp. 2319x1 TaxID=1674923 RepID=UPI0015823AB2|nr:Ig-like domain-containing protein [Thermococcus sp. 2319x1]
MKKTLALITLALLTFGTFGLALERHFEYENAYENDKGIYVYFRVILLYSEMALDKVIDENNESIYYADNVATKLKVTQEEIEFYKSFGIKAKVEDYLPPFLEFGEGIKNIAEGQRLFLDNIEIVKEFRDYYAYLNASQGLEMMGEGISKAEKALDVIDTFAFLDEDNGTLTLDTSPIRGKLEKIKRMYLGYERALNTYKVFSPEEAKNISTIDETVIVLPTSLVLYASKLNPFVYENVTFYGYAPGFESVNLHIGNKTIVVMVKNNRFSYIYSFDRTGTYEVFATGVKNGSVESSNVLIIRVLKIPTRIVLSSKGSAYINESLKVNGFLLDYYGNALNGEKVLGEFNGKKFTLLTSGNGSFSFNVTSGESGRKIVNVTYHGNEIYTGSSASLSVVFLKYPVRISIRADRGKVREGEEVKIIGKIDGVEGEIPITVYVDGKPYTSIYAAKGFEVKVSFNGTGMHEIYAHFPGNEYYDEARSNVISIKVVRFLVIDYLLFALILGLLGSIVYLSRKIYLRSGKGVTDEEFVRLMKALEEIEKEEMKEGERKLKSLREMYREIYQKLLKHYGLKSSTTPRELVKRLEKESFAPYLEKLTSLYERYFYGKKPLGRHGVLEYLRSVAGFIVSFIVREEL